MNTSIRNYLVRLRLVSTTSGFYRACPKCKKKHCEYRTTEMTNSINSAQHAEYVKDYQNMCFKCIQMELLLPGE